MNREYNIDYMPDSIDDLHDIRRYIRYRLRSPIAAERTIERIQDEIDELSFMPYMYAPFDREPWRSMGYHKFSIKKYTVYYTIDESAKTVEIQHIVYGARDIENIFPH